MRAPLVHRTFLLLPALLVACGPSPSTLVSDDLTDLPLPRLSADWQQRFDQGDRLFEVTFTAADGVGPLSIRQSCAACHQGGGRGPGFVEKMAQLGPDGVTPLEGQPSLRFGHTVRRQLWAGASTPLVPPAGVPVSSSQRSGLAVWGVSSIAAVADETLLDLEAAQARRTDGVSGRVNRVTYLSEQNADPRFRQLKPGQQVIGRYGAKARVATLDDFAADALQGDMGLTTPLRPTEVPNPDGLLDDARPGVDVDLDTVNLLADYLRLLRVPARAVPAEAAVRDFEGLGCSTCHVPTLPTRADYPVPQLAATTVSVYSDVLLHDLGPTFADGLVEGSASSTEFRTAPLVGLRFHTSFLHDGRARSVEEAITLHGADGSEAAGSVSAFQSLSLERRRALVAFVESL